MSGKRKPLAPEHKAKIAASLRLYNRSDEVRAQRAEEQRRRFADPAERKAAAERMRKIWSDLRDEGGSA